MKARTVMSRAREGGAARLASRGGAVALAGLALASAPAVGQKSELVMLDRLDRGSWELRSREDGAEAERICLRSGRELIQLRHRGLPCEHVVVMDTPNEVTVQYMCRGKGYGRTHIRRETDGLVQIDSQGIVNGQPFVFAAEGRRLGGC